MVQEERKEAQARIADFNSTFKEYATIWYERDCMPSLSQATRSSYLTTFNKHLFTAFGDKKIHEITLADVKDWLNSYANKVVGNTLDKILNRFN